MCRGGSFFGRVIDEGKSRSAQAEAVREQLVQVWQERWNMGTKIKWTH